MRRTARRHRERLRARRRDDRRGRPRPARPCALPRRPPWRSSPASTTPAMSPPLAALVATHDVRLVVPAHRPRPGDRLGRPGRARAGARARAARPTCAGRWATSTSRTSSSSRTGSPSPRTWLPDDVPGDVRYPLLVKVREGFGSRHIYRADDARAARVPPPARRRSTRWCRSVCLGEEFSIDVFCDVEGRCLNAIPRSMIQSKGGESIKGRSLRDAELIEHGARVAETIGIVGPGERPVLPRAGRLAARDRRQPALRRRLPAAARRGQQVPGARARARPRRAARSRGSASSARAS